MDTMTFARGQDGQILLEEGAALERASGDAISIDLMEDDLFGASKQEYLQNTQESVGVESSRTLRKIRS
jgi:hypothetical protein